MKRILGFLILLSAPNAFADQSVTLSPIVLEVNAADVSSKLEQTLLFPERMLMRYQPVGAKISNKRVLKNEIEFTATKKVLFLSKSVHVGGILESRVDLQACKSEDLGYSLKMRLDSSDAVVSDNVEELEATICLNLKSDSSLIGEVRPKVILGKKYSKTFGPIAVKLIKEQVSPLLTALTEEINSLR